MEATLRQEPDLRCEKSGAGDCEPLVVMCHLARVYKRLAKFQDVATLLKRLIRDLVTVCGDDHYESLPKKLLE